MKLLFLHLKSFLQRLSTLIYFLSVPVSIRERTMLASHFMRGRLFKEYSDEQRLEEAMKWLCVAQDACGGKGISALYHLKTGWGVAYPETSGYILATFLAYFDFTGDDSYFKRALQIGDWEIEIQTPGGGILSSPNVSYTRVFNTGQVILGWCALYERTREVMYLNAALRAGEYLIKIQEEDGSWKNDTYCGPRTYHSRVDWALLRLSKLSGDQQFEKTAYRNIQWVLKQQRENGWFGECGFNHDVPITHVIAYTLRGLLECHLMNIPVINDLKILTAVIKAADALCSALEKFPVKGIKGMVPASFNSAWQSTDQHSCLTGNAQLSILLFRLAHATNNEPYRKIAVTVLRATAKTQLIDTSLQPIKGAIGGTYPLYDGYLAFAFPNWAAKFFADALLMKLQYEKTLTIPA